MSAYKYFIVINAMKTKADKFDLRLRLVRYAVSNGIKTAARAYATTPKTVRKWLNRYKSAGLLKSMDLSENLAKSINVKKTCER